MDIIEAIKARHSVRAYTDRVINPDIITELKKESAAINAESGLHMQIIENEPKAFGGLMSRYGKFENVRNYIAVVGRKGKDLDEKAGYFGERPLLKAVQLGLDTCWVALTFSRGKSRCTVSDNEKLVCVIAFGYGRTHGAAHKSRPVDSLCTFSGKMPEWFDRGMQAAMLAPTAVNQQKFMFSLNGNRVKAVSTGGFYSKVDLGIVKYHFETAAGKENFDWEQD